MQSYLPACKIVSTHGVRGEMKALPLCDGAEFLAKFKRLYATADGTGECRVLGVRTQGNVILLRLADVTDMDAARAQVGRTYYFAKADARLPKGRYFIDDLLGCEVKDAIPEMNALLQRILPLRPLRDCGFTEADFKIFPQSVETNQQRLMTNAYYPFDLESEEAIYRKCY